MAKIKRGRLKPKGVWLEFEGVGLRFEAHLNKACWLSLIACSMLWLSTWYSSPFILWICICGHLERWDVRLMVHLILESAQESIEKNNMEIIGGPGNRTQVPMITSQLTSTTTSFACLCQDTTSSRLFYYPSLVITFPLLSS